MRSGQRKSAAVPVRCGGFFFRHIVFAGVIALLLRIGVSVELAGINNGINSVFTPSKATDLCTYMDLAAKIAAGEYSGVFYYQPFYYAVFLPLIRVLSGAQIWAVILVQCLLGAGTAMLSGLSAGRIFGKKAGIFAAYLTAVSIPLLLYTPFHQNETLQSFNIVLLFYLTLLAVQRGKVRAFLLAGAVAGAAILTRGNINLLLPVIVLAMLLSFFRRREKFSVSAGKMLLFLVMVLLVQLPFIWHNSRLLGRLSGPSTAADAVLALGNTWEAPAGGREPGLPAGPMEYPEAFSRAMVLAEKGVSMGRQMWDMLLENPPAFLELQMRKLLLFWDYREIPNNVSLYGEGQFSWILQYCLIGSSGILLALTLGGMLFFFRKMLRRHSIELLLLYGFILLYWGAVAVFYILSRFRAPILPVCAVMAGGFLALLLNRIRFRRGHLTALLALVAGAWISFCGYEFYRLQCEKSVMRWVRPAGTVLKAVPGYGESRLDHGPATFGSWESVPLTAGTVLTKQFSGNGQVADWTIFANAGGILVCRDAEPLVLKKGLNVFRVKAAGNAAVMEVISAPDGVFGVLDAQRDYGRSQLNHAPAAGEWVVRLTSLSEK